MREGGAIAKYINRRGWEEIVLKQVTEMSVRCEGSHEKN